LQLLEVIQKLKIEILLKNVLTLSSLGV
jgi:hypothetical protein